jgi:NAD(P)-dependent dehydrogenase (short-subunit alcohol dehydrogenase family)
VIASAAQPVAIVTGAGGNLGVAVVQVLAGAGHRLVAVERTAAALDQALDGIDAGRVQAEPGIDLGDPAACRALVERAMRHFGRIDGLVHTVGAFAMAEVEAGEAAHWERLFQANLFTAVNMCRAVVPAMRAAGRGSIITVGAAAAARAGKGMAAYASAKSTVLRLTEALAAELKDAGVRANCVLPGTIDTPPNRAAMPGADTSRWVAPEQIAAVIAFLLSDAAAAVTGAAIPVTGRG